LIDKADDPEEGEGRVTFADAEEDNDEDIKVKFASVEVDDKEVLDELVDILEEETDESEVAVAGGIGGDDEKLFSIGPVGEDELGKPDIDGKVGPVGKGGIPEDGSGTPAGIDEPVVELLSFAAVERTANF